MNSKQLMLGAFALLATTASWAQDGPAPRLESVTLVNINFGTTPSIVVKLDGADKTFQVNANTRFMENNAAATLTNFAQRQLNRTVHLQIERQTSGPMVTRMWDAASFGSWLSGHAGTRNGTVKAFSPKVLALGDHIYAITDETRFVKESKNVGRKKLEGASVLWITCEVKNGVAVAMVIGDTSTSLGVQPKGTSTRPPSNSRPASTGTGGTAGNDSGRSPTERGNRPASTGSGSVSPTERGSTRPPSTGTGGTAGSKDGKSPTERSQGRPASTGTGGTASSKDGKSPTERGNSRPASTGAKQLSPSQQSQTIFLVKVSVTINNGNDNIPGNEVSEVTEAVRKAYGAEDNELEVFGTIELDGQMGWVGDRADAEKNRFGAKQSVRATFNQGGEYKAVKGPRAKLHISLKDRDMMSSDDNLLTFNQELNIYEIWRTGSKSIASANGRATIVITVITK